MKKKLIQKFNIQKICEEENVDLLVIDDEVANRNFDIVSILGSGTQVIGFLISGRNTSDVFLPRRLIKHGCQN